MILKMVERNSAGELDLAADSVKPLNSEKDDLCPIKSAS